LIRRGSASFSGEALKDLHRAVEHWMVDAIAIGPKVKTRLHFSGDTGKRDDSVGDLFLR
jgi:hypothetical protein